MIEKNGEHDVFLELKNINFSYGKSNIIDNLSLKVEKGRIICFFGLNGSGKSTLLEIICGLLTPDSGEIFIEGKSLSKFKEREVARYISLVPQFNEVTFSYTVHQMVLMGRTPFLESYSSPKKEDYKIADEALKKVGMIDFKDRNFNELSGGEAQMVKLARAIAQEAKILVLDEPTAHLDFKNEIKVISQISRLAKENNITVLMATHFPNHAFYFELKNNNIEVALLNKGKIEYIGTPTMVLNENNMERIYGVKTKVLEDSIDGIKIKYMMLTDLK